MVYKIPERDTHSRAVCTSCNYIDYQNPNIVAGILPTYNNTILLCKRNIEPAKGKWTIPSGFLELNETVEEGALREAKEEAGINARISHLYCMYNLPHIGQVYMLYLASMTDRTINPGYETQEARLFTLETIPWDNIAFSAVSFSLKHYVKDFQNKTFPFRTSTYTHDSL